MFNAFVIFDLQPTFTIDLDQVEKIYLELIKQHHPDKYVNESKDEQLLHLMQTSQINEAYDILKDPIKRGQHLINLHNNVEGFKDSVIKDKEFIFEQFKLREKVDKLKSNFDFELFDQLDQYLVKLNKDILDQLGEAFENQNFEQAQMLVYRMQYLRKLESELKTIE